jgi:hypothetical protein
MRNLCYDATVHLIVPHCVGMFESPEEVSDDGVSLGTGILPRLPSGLPHLNAANALYAQMAAAVARMPSPAAAAGGGSGNVRLLHPRALDSLLTTIGRRQRREMEETSSERQVCSPCECSLLWPPWISDEELIP